MINHLLVCCILLFSSLIAVSVHAQETLTESAEIVGTIEDLTDYKIPSIKTSEWTKINIKVVDGYGLNWTRLSSNMYFLATYVWPIIHPTWKRFLGYSSLRFEPEVVDGDPRGWYTKITPSAIQTADQGKTYFLTLEVKTDDIAVDYSVVIGVKVIRVAPDGTDYGMSYIYIPVKASSLNNLKMSTGFTTKEAAPHSFVNFDVALINLGYYRDTFKLHFVEENGLIIGATQQLIVLNPSESQNVRFNVLTDEKFFDIGTSNRINIYATSASDPDPQLIGTVIVTTRGIYLSPLIGIILSPILLLIIIIFIFWFFIKNRRDVEIYGKPEKPWTIPEEKAYLQDLKQNNKEAYQQERTMMKDEYKSALLWHQDYRRTEKQGRVEEQPVQKESLIKKMSAFFKKPEKEPVKKEKPKKKALVPLKKPAEKPKKEALTPTGPVEDKSKEDAIAKIKKEQEKQLRRLK